MAAQGPPSDAPAPPPPPPVLWDPSKKRFSTSDGLAYLQYTLRSVKKDEKAMDLVHTFVPSSKRGTGIAAHLCEAAFQHAKEHGFSVIPTCSYVSVCIHIHAHTYTFTCVYLCGYCTCMYIYVHMYVYICTYAYI
mgnify:FL=1